MNRQDVTKLLGYAAACDARTVGMADQDAWFDILAPLDLDACLAAARKHYREQPDVRLKPGHLWRMVRATTGATAADVCEQGAQCDDCKLVHRADEPCGVNVADPETFTRALGAFRRLDPVSTP